MRTILTVAMLVAVAAPAGAQERLEDQLRKGIVEEETNQNVEKAIQAYQSVVSRYDQDRKVAGSALFRLAECYRKAGKRDQAVAAYQRVLREFSDQQAMVESSHQQLTALGADVVETRPVPVARARTTGGRGRAVPAAGVEQPHEVAPTSAPALAQSPTGSLQVAQQEMRVALQQLADMQKRFDAGQATEYAVQGAAARLEETRQRVKQVEAQIKLNQAMLTSVQKEIDLVQSRINDIEANIQKGRISPDSAELLQLKRDLIALQLKRDQLRIEMDARR